MINYNDSYCYDQFFLKFMETDKKILIFYYFLFLLSAGNSEKKEEMN